MTKHRLLFTLPLVLAPWVAPSAMTAEEASGAVECEIRATTVPGGVRLQPVAVARMPVSGTYAFVATARNAGSTSNTSQSGTFDLEAGEERVLGDVILGLGEGASHVARLTLRWGDREVSCGEDYPRKA